MNIVKDNNNNQSVADISTSSPKKNDTKGQDEASNEAPPFISFTEKQEFTILTMKLDLIPTKCEIPPKEEFEPVEKFVEKAVREQHDHGDDAESQLPQYKGILDMLRIRKDRLMLHRILLALRTAGQGATLRLLTTSKTSKHARLMHNISRLNAFELPGPDKSKEADYDIVDAHFHLLRAIISSNTVYLVPTLRTLWRMLSVDNNEPIDVKRYAQYA
jgi:hypothetical protein